MAKKDGVDVMLMGLFFKCPLGAEHERCALGKFRMVPEKDRVKFLNVLTFNERDILIARHENCLVTRESFEENRYSLINSVF